MSLPTRFHFQSSALADENPQVIRFTGEEGISQLYRFEIEFITDNPVIHLADVLSQPASLTLEQGGGKRHIHGMIAEMELSQELPDQRYVYRALLTPRLWLLTLNQQNQIYQNLNIPRIIEQVLLSAGYNVAGAFENNTFFTDYIEFRLSDDTLESNSSNTYPEREYIVQYRETDLNFISRLMEHEGMSYFFEQGEDGEKLIISDSNHSFPRSKGVADIAYQVAGNECQPNQSRPYSPAVWQLRPKQQQLPHQVILKDYNYRHAAMPYQGCQIVDDNGIGLVAEYGAHFKTPEEGQHYANVRAEELRCQQHIFSVESNNHYFSAAEHFTLKGHYLKDVNRDYLITHVSHTGVVDECGTAPQCDYQNTLRCQPLGVTFRPPRVTPKPRLYGIMNAIVDGGSDDDNAEIDHQGRYKVIMPFDLSGVGEGQASRYLRLSTPYSGSKQGMHFPLLKGTEVIWTCIDGDLDRPIIVGTVPNSVNKSVVTCENKNTNVIKTSSGIRMEFNDGTFSGFNNSGFNNSGFNNNEFNKNGLTLKTASMVDHDLLAAQTPVGNDNENNHFDLHQQQHYSSAAILISTKDVDEGRVMQFTVTLPHLPAPGHTATLNFVVSGDGAQGTTTPNLLIDSNSSLLQTILINTLSDINTERATVTLSLSSITYSNAYPASQHYLAQATATGNVLDKEVNLANEGGTVFYRVDVPYVTDNSAYLRMGTSPISIDDDTDPPTCIPGNDTECNVWRFHYDEFLNISDEKVLWVFPTPDDINFAIKWPECKWLEHTDGTRVAITGGDYNIFAKGSVATTSLGTSITYTLNDNYEVVMSSKYDVTSQFSSNIGIGGAVNAFLGAQVDLTVGTKFEASPQQKISVLGGGELTYTNNIETNAAKSIKLQVEDTNTKACVIAGSIAAALGVTTGAIASDLLSESNDPAQKDKLTRAIRNVSTAVWGLGTAAVTTLAAMSLIKKFKPKPQSTFEMIKDQIFLQCGESTLLMQADGTIIFNSKKIILNGTEKVEINSKNAMVSATDTTLKAKNFTLDAATKMNGNLDIQKGSLEVPNGTIKGAGGKIGEQVFLSPPPKPVISEADVQLTRQFGSVEQLLQIAMLRRRQMLMADEDAN
ncbi:MAG: type VI secretion system tip protein VgrG [Gammaproteobacteria bacterium]|nr:type VI secretion system tip protein VgrG [Gammaproteobacteria bacterium]